MDSVGLLRRAHKFGRESDCRDKGGIEEERMGVDLVKICYMHV